MATNRFFPDPLRASLRKTTVTLWIYALHYSSVVSLFGITLWLLVARFTDIDRELAGDVIWNFTGLALAGIVSAGAGYTIKSIGRNKYYQPGSPEDPQEDPPEDPNAPPK